MYGLHEEEAMTKGISGVHFIREKRWRRVDITCYLHRGVDIGVMKLSGSFGDAQTAIAPSSVAIDMKNTINIDKYMKRFIAKTNMSFHNKSVCYRYMLKYNIKIF